MNFVKDSKYQQFANLSFEDFRRMAADESLSSCEKAGFPDSYRKGKEQSILEAILAALPLLAQTHKVVLDIGPGCSELALLLIDLCRKNDHTLLLVDSEEVLSHLPDESFMKKFSAYYPNCDSLRQDYRGKVNVILTYSVLHYVFTEGNLWDFLDSSLELLAEGGEMLIGDIPNVSKRKRFFCSRQGIKFHQEFTGAQNLPEVNFNHIQRHLIDDSVILSLLTRARNQGFDAYVFPQRNDLPMANRREDILIRRP